MKREHFGTFDLIRLIAALAVIISHSFPLTGTPDPFEIRFGRSVAYIGSLSVGAFFIISGYLITQIWCSLPQPPEYLAKRLLRIWPGLAVAVLLSAFAFGLVMTDMSLSEYVTSRASWNYVVHTIFMAP